METVAGTQRRTAPHGGHPVPAEPAVPSAVPSRQLLLELDSALAFADYCRYLGGEALTSRVEQFLELAEALYRDTLASLPNTHPAAHR